MWVQDPGSSPKSLWRLSTHTLSTNSSTTPTHNSNNHPHRSHKESIRVADINFKHAIWCGMKINTAHIHSHENNHYEL